MIYLKLIDAGKLNDEMILGCDGMCIKKMNSSDIVSLFNSGKISNRVFEYAIKLNLVDISKLKNSEFLSVDQSDILVPNKERAISGR